MKNYPKRIKNTLHSVIRDMAKHPEDFCRCPEKDFTRNRKLPFEKLLTLLVKMGGHSLRDEMLDCLAFQETPASASALVQQRSKLLPEALEYLFREFTNRCHNPYASLFSPQRSMMHKQLFVNGLPICFFPPNPVALIWAVRSIGTRQRAPGIVPVTVPGLMRREGY